MISLPRAYGHVDADCFFASVELLARPELKGKPVMACNRIDRRGIVLSATYEARPFGIRAGTPVFKAKVMCPQGIFLQSHFHDYEAISYKMMEILRSFSPDVEPASVDEAYIDLTGLRLLHRTSYEGIAQKIQEKITRDLGITVSFGIAPSKLLAKIASAFKKPSGLTVVTEKNREEFLRQVPIADIPGVGRNTQALLKKYDFETAYDIAKSPQKITALLGKRGEETCKELNGVALASISRGEGSKPKSLSFTRTFPDFSDNREYIFSFSLSLLSQLCARLRSYQLSAQIMTFFLITKEFSTESRTHLLATPTDEEKYFVRPFEKIFSDIFNPHQTYRKAGFFLENLHPQGARQYSLFERPPSGEVEGAVDRINQKYGSGGILRGIFLKSPRKRQKTYY